MITRMSTWHSGDPHFLSFHKHEGVSGANPGKMLPGVSYKVTFYTKVKNKQKKPRHAEKV